jgi:hypothetical protein
VCKTCFLVVNLFQFRLEAWKGTTRRIVQALVDQLIASNPSLEHCVNDEELQDQVIVKYLIQH